MSLRSAFFLCLGLLLPGVALAQVPTITITPSIGAGQKTVFNLASCADLNTDHEFYSVKIDFGLAAPAAGDTFDIKLGDKCDGSTGDLCTILQNDISLTQTVTTIPVSFTVQDVVDVSASTTPTCENTDVQLSLFVVVNDSVGTTPLGKLDTKDAEDVYLDSIIPEPPLNLSADGGENILHISWETNPANTNGAFKLNPQEAKFQAQCRLASDTNGTFVDCGSLVSAVFTTDVTTLNGVALANDVDIEFQVITIDTAGNESVPSASAIGAPQNVIDFGDNYNGSEQGGCAVGQVPSNLVWIALLLAVVYLLRRSQKEAL